MFDSSAVLDVVIGLAFVYLLLSLVCTSFSEFVSQIFGMRAATLEKWLKQVLGDAASDFFEDPRVRALMRGDPPAAPSAAAGGFAATGWDKTKRYVSRVWRSWRLPSYVPGRTFAAVALKDYVNKGALIDIPDENRNYVQEVIATAEKDVGRARKALELAYDDAMDRVTGWYKRNVQMIVAGIAIAVAFGLNVDTLAIGKTLWQDESVRAAVVAAAERRVEEATPEPSTEPTPTLNEDDDSPSDDDSTEADAIADSKEVEAELDALGVPIGWDGWPDGWDGWAEKLAGLFMTALALSLGAPFWFDALSKLVNVRGAGKQPATTN
jgi:hypothetical protein